MYKNVECHLAIFCINFVRPGGSPSPVRIITQVPWFIYQNRLGPSGGIYYPNFVACFVVLFLNLKVLIHFTFHRIVLRILNSEIPRCLHIFREGNTSLKKSSNFFDFILSIHTVIQCTRVKNTLQQRLSDFYPIHSEQNRHARQERDIIGALENMRTKYAPPPKRYLHRNTVPDSSSHREVVSIIIVGKIDLHSRGAQTSLRSLIYFSISFTKVKSIHSSMNYDHSLTSSNQIHQSP